MGDFLKIANELGIPWAIATGLAIAYWRAERDHRKFLEGTVCEALADLAQAAATTTTILDERLPRRFQ